jgi:transcriptional regulator of acetoin/glycerol metabolism
LEDLVSDSGKEALQLESGRVSAAAKRLGMSRAIFWRKRKKYGL